MTNSAYLMDTNAAIALLNQDPSLLQFISTRTIYLCATVLGELYFGAHKSAKREINVRKIDQLANQYPVLASERITATFYGSLYAQLRARGKPIPYNDVWIAAAAPQHNLILITRDSDFDAVDNLQKVSW